MAFLVPSLKKTKDVDFGQSAKLQEQLVRLTSKASAPACSASLKKLTALRKELPEEPTQRAIEQHVAYWAELSQFEMRVEGFASLGIKFAWYDSWQVGVLASPVKSSGCTLEIASVLFNGATLALQHGALCHGRNTAESLTEASKSFLR